MYNHELVLIKQTVVTDDLGNQTIEESRNTVLCKVNSIGRNEFYEAATHGMKPEIEFVIHGYEYEDEQQVVFEGAEYKVIRTYKEDFEEVELTCEKSDR
ncbi:phage head-tail adaptor, putative, SPP1 family [Salinibacillus kushneri]|uniref:Phage head-tail adaptor, putative, SPP1 family n=1 Tax=Salinibacillus kushneri TaxID=237682 RepID=A0A1I0B5R1_9BACI|nr:phage head closure protein [Salinibacillus kushneri]SET02210.1 phage head-tail adaptor, putative, SPP1 family [Salinibacillus kushneri]